MVKLRLIIFLTILGLCSSLPMKEKKAEEHHTETKNEAPPQEGEDWELSLEYGRYLKEIVQALESDTEFRKKLESADVEDIKSGKISRELHLVDHNIRTKLDELKRRELERLRHLAVKEHEKKVGVDRSKLKVPVHVDYKNPESFEAEDLRKLITQLNKDLEIVDEKRKKEFKTYEMEKNYNYQHQMDSMTEEQKQKLIKEHEEQSSKHKQHPKLHHPGSKQQFEEVWEEQDHMKGEDFDPRTFFHVHDLDGNGQWDENEVKALFQNELNKMYDPNAPEDDLMERYEEMERMREHVFKESDLNQDNLISFEEFLEQTKKSDFERDEGWQGLDEQELYSQQEYEEYERQRQMEIQRLIESGVIPPPPGYQGLNVPHHVDFGNGVGMPPVYQAPAGNGPSVVPQGYQAVPVAQGYQAAPEGYQAVPQGYQAVPQGYQAVPQGYQAVPQGYQAVPQGYQAVPQGNQAVPQGHLSPPPVQDQRLPQAQAAPVVQGVPQAQAVPQAQGVPKAQTINQAQGSPQANAVPQSQGTPQVQAKVQSQSVPQAQGVGSRAQTSKTKDPETLGVHQPQPHEQQQQQQQYKLPQQQPPQQQQYQQPPQQQQYQQPPQQQQYQQPPQQQHYQQPPQQQQYQQLQHQQQHQQQLRQQYQQQQGGAHDSLAQHPEIKPVAGNQIPNAK